MKFDGVAIVVVTERGKTFIELVKKNPKFRLSTARREEPTITIARISKKQASALGFLLLKNGE